MSEGGFSAGQPGFWILSGNKFAELLKAGLNFLTRTVEPVPE